MSPAEFQSVAATELAKHYGKQLGQKRIPVGGAWKEFDYVSADREITGDAKFYSDCRSPSGKLATISECVFLLEKCSANHKFIIFGNNIEVPKRWLRRYQSLLNRITFYFLDGAGLKRLN